MCLIIENKSNHRLFDIISKEEVLEYMTVNPDGFGITYFSGSKNIISTIKGFDKDSFLQCLKKIEDTKELHYYIHFRKATVGAISIENTHPFDVMGNQSLFLMHNGTLPLFSNNQTLEAQTSDTYFLSQEIKQLILTNGSNYIQEDHFHQTIEKILGHGRAVLIKSDKSYIFNKNLWFNIEDKLLLSKCRKEVLKYNNN